MVKTVHVCSECAYRAHQWHGRCPDCGAWDSFAPAPSEGAASGHASPIRLASVDLTSKKKLTTGISEFDRALGGGLVAGSVVLIAGEPGVGKSTLMLQVADGLSQRGSEVILVCGEESLEQVASRAQRLGRLNGALGTAATDLPTVVDQIVSADVAVVDSVQTLRDPSAPGEPGSISQVRACAAELARAAHATGTTVLLIGHVTKDGGVAGPRALEHLVDAVVSFEGDRGHALRTIRATKNRFGPTSEIGVFEMTAKGLVEVADASGLFLKDRMPGSPGSAVACVLEGRRPLAVEVQAIVAKSPTASPRRVANGIDGVRLGVIAAILDRRAQVRLLDQDVYASIAGGLRVVEPGLDLALAIAMASSRLDKPVPPDCAFIGEVGLGGEIRSVAGIDARIEEVSRLGFKKVVVPAGESNGNHGPIETIRVQELNEVLGLLW